MLPFLAENGVPARGVLHVKQREAKDIDDLVPEIKLANGVIVATCVDEFSICYMLSP